MEEAAEAAEAALPYDKTHVKGQGWGWNEASRMLYRYEPIAPKWMMIIMSASYIWILLFTHPTASIQYLAPTVTTPSSLSSFAPQGSRERARVRNCVGMAVCVIEGVGPLGESGELHEFVMSAMLAMAY
ncbi:hypothetical protein PAMP_010960 [Pampus punctatissimus]